MRADGPSGVALCRGCHDEYMALWCAEDAASELAETIDGYRGVA